MSDPPQTRSITIAVPCPTPTHIVHSAYARRATQLMRRRQHQPRARHAQRVAKRDRPAIGVHVLRVVRHAEGAQRGERLGREGLVQLDHIHLPDGEPEPVEHLARRFDRSDAHDAGFHPGGGHAEDARHGRQPMRLRRLPARDQKRRRTVVDARGIARRHGQLRAVDAAQLRQRVGRGVGARVLVPVDDQRIALARGIVTGTISSANRPAASALAHLSWLRSAKASWSAREMP
jgi:hypothetical protein